MNNHIEEYIDGSSTKDEFLKKYNSFIHKFNLFKKTKRVKKNFA